MERWWTALCTIAAGCLGAAAPLAAQLAPEMQPPAEETFFDHLEVHVVEVDVVVTDRQGRRVTGLTRDEFEVLEEGRPVAITHFYAADSGAADGGEPLQLAVFLDNQSLTPAARGRVVPALKSLVASRMRPDEQILLATYDGPGSLKVRQASTGEPWAVVAALEEVAAAPPSTFENGFELRNLLLQMKQATMRGPQLCDRGALGRGFRQAEASSLLASIDSYAEQSYERIRGSAGALGRFVDALAGLPGRKAVLFVSGGMPLRPAQWLYDVWESRFACVGPDRDVRSRLRGIVQESASLIHEVAERASTNRIGFYSLAAPNLLRAGSAENGLFDLWTLDREIAQANNLTQALFLLSAPTGGMALDTAEGADPAALLAGLREDFDLYYSLAYVPPHRRTGRTHRIEVRVKRPELAVRHRELYRDRSSREVLRDRTMAALLFGRGENPLKVALEFGPEIVDEQGRKVVTVAVKLPMSNLVLMPRGPFHEGQVTIHLAAREAEGNGPEIQAVSVPVRVPNRKLLTALGWIAGYRTKLVLGAGAQIVAVGVRDELGNVASTLASAYASDRQAVAAAAGSHPALVLLASAGAAERTEREQ